VGQGTYLSNPELTGIVLIEVLLDEYEEHMKLHGMKVNKGATETLVTVAGK
jgi:hypothetical protein